jgi:uncharacterized protein with beta-barrel porin domain
VRNLTQAAVSRRTSLRIIRTSLLCRTALATASLSIALVTAAVHPVLAGGGNGGAGSAGEIGGGTGGADGQSGGGGFDANNADQAGGGGGGGGAGQGTGGTGGSGATFGTPTAGGSAGNPGTGTTSNDAGAGGGGGGYGGANGFEANGSVSVLGPGVLAGDAGGAGGAGGSASGDFSDGGGGGGGGAGGHGLVLFAGQFVANSVASITGGNGGNGGAGGTVSGADSLSGNGGNGGAGGIGVLLNVSGVSLTNTGIIQGGNGGSGGAAGNTLGSSDARGYAGAAGLGGAGIVGSGLTVINSGTIAGGLADGGAGARADAITFTGGSNFLDLSGGTLIGNIGVTGSLTFNQTGAVSLPNVITGSGAVFDSGSGTLTLSGVNTYSGLTTVNGGLLEIDGSIAASGGVTVNAGGTLDGTGILGATTINNGGTFMPGNGTPGSSMTVAGSLALQSGALFMVQINPATASFANVTGTAYLGGATVGAIFAAGSYVSKQYTLVQATGGVSGTFNPAVVNTNLPSNFHTTLSYDTHDAYLDLALNFGIPGSLNGNQQNVGNALTNFFNATDGIPIVFGALSPAALTQASGEIATGSQQTTFDAMNMFMGAMTDPFIDGRGAPVPAGSSTGASAYAAQDNPRSGTTRDADAMFTKAPVMADPFAQRWSVWTAGYGGSQTTDGNAAAGSNATKSAIYGTAVGADYRFSPFTLAGFALAGGGTNFSVNGSGSGRSDLFQAGAFVRHTVGPAYISAALAYGWQDITTDRTVTIAGVDQLRAEFDANAFSGRAEGGYRFVSPWMGGIGITPYAAGQFTTFDLPAYAEQAVAGTNTFALAYGAKSVTDPRSELGLRGDKSFAMPDGILTLRGGVAWAHDFNPDRSIGATFQTLPGASFVVNGAAQASDSALVTASAEKKWLNGWSAAATFEGEFSNVTNSYAGKGVVRYSF